MGSQYPQSTLSLHTLSPEDQERLRKEVNLPSQWDCLGGRVIQFDTTTGKMREPNKVVLTFFDMDLYIESRYVYLFPSDIEEGPKEKEKGTLP